MQPKGWTTNGVIHSQTCISTQNENCCASSNSNCFFPKPVIKREVGNQSAHTLNSELLMKAVIISTGLLMFLGLAFAPAALDPTNAPPKAVDQVLFQNNRSWSGTANALTANDSDVCVARIVIVKTNGVYRVSNGKSRQLLEGQCVQSDGNLISPDGSISPVVDHVVMKNGKPVLVKDGESSTVDQILSLSDGSQIQPDGFHVAVGGRRTRLLDGQLVKLDGSFLQVSDSILMQKGQVSVQKDGALIPVKRNATIVMNDGTRVYGDGRIERMDGTTSNLTEGQIVLVPGVIRR
jgi:hypothetical protein